MLRMNKKGELSSSQLVTIIILIVSFAVILIFFYMFNFKGEVSKESCRNSVVLRGTAMSKSVVQLQCETKDVCFSKTGNCDSAKKGTEIIRVVDKPALLNELGTLMYDCWWQFGEGKIDYRAAGIGSTESYCAVCNTIKFDSSIKGNSEMNSISLADLYGSLQNRKVPNRDESYLQYMFKFNDIDAVASSLKAVTPDYGPQLDIYSKTIDLSQGDMALVTALNKEGWGKTLAGFGTGATAGGLYASWPGVIIGGLGGAAIGYVSTDNNVKYLPPTLYGYNSEDFKGLNCKAFTTLS